MATSIVSGTQAATIDTEHTLSTQASAGSYVLSVDLNNLALGDVVILRVKIKVGSGGTTREVLSNTFSNPQGQPVVQSIPVASPHEAIFTLEQIEGTVRSFSWEVISL